MSSALPRTTLTCRAYAKVNLTLEILGKRPDGYHEIATVMQTLALHDLLTFAPSSQLALTSDVPEMALPDNLILRAAYELQAQTRTQRGASIHLEKRIPLAAGLGGGSSDAACALRTLNDLWDLRLPIGRLAQIGARIGSDVPFFLYDGTALAEGRGEIVTPLPPFPRTWVLLVCPRVRLPGKTAMLYSKVRPSDYSDGTATRRLTEALHQGRRVDPKELVNVFLPILLRESPAVRVCYERMQEIGAHPLLSGSGPALFALVEEEAQARRFRELLGELDADIFVTRTVAAEEIGN